MLQGSRSTICRIPRILYLLESRRCCHATPNPSENLPFHKKIYEKLRFYVLGEQSIAFDPELIQSALRVDKVDGKEWKLIYYDFDSSRIGAFTVLCIASCVICISIAAADYWMHGDFTISAAKVLRDDAEEFGPYIAIPATLLVSIVTIIFRLHAMKIFRIYQSQTNPEKFTLIYPGFFKLYNKKHFTRSEVLPKAFLYQELSSMIDVFKAGNLKIGKRSWILNIEAFHSQPFKSYMLNERDQVPEELQTRGFPRRLGSSSARRKPPVPPPF